MKELKTYISEGFFSNIGANNKVKPVIDAIKDASMNNKVDSLKKQGEFAGLLESILKNIETDIKKGKFVFEYIKNDETGKNSKITISFEKSESNNVKWIYSNYSSKYKKNHPHRIAFNIALDLYYEAMYPIKELESQHSIANTINVIEYKVL